MGAQQKIVEVEEDASGCFRVVVAHEVVDAAGACLGRIGHFVGGDFETRDQAETAAAALRVPTPAPTLEQLAHEADAWRELAAALDARAVQRIERAREGVRELGLHAFLAPAVERIAGRQ